MSFPGGIDAYFQLINDILANSPVIRSQDIFAEKRTLTEGYLCAWFHHYNARQTMEAGIKETKQVFRLRRQSSESALRARPLLTGSLDHFCCQLDPLGNGLDRAACPAK